MKNVVGKMPFKAPSPGPISSEILQSTEKEETGDSGVNQIVAESCKTASLLLNGTTQEVETLRGNSEFGKDVSSFNKDSAPNETRESSPDIQPQVQSEPNCDSEATQKRRPFGSLQNGPGLVNMDRFKIFGGKFIDKRRIIPESARLDAKMAMGHVLDPFGMFSKIKNSVEVKMSILGKPFGHFIFRYVEEGVLGNGGFGKVVRVRPKKNKNGQTLACKIQNKSRIMADGLQGLLINELAILEHMRGEPRSVQMVEYFEGYQNVYILFEVCEGGDVLHLIRDNIKQNGVYTEAEAAKLMKQMLLAVQACHERGILHRDIKPENFMLNSRDDDAIVKITDYGLSTFLKPGEQINTICGTPPFMSPEMWMGRPYGVKVDVWALGVTLSMCLTGNFPFRGKTPEELGKAIVRNTIDYTQAPWSLMSEPCIQFFKGLLEKDPNSRITVPDALVHPWLNGAASSNNIAFVIEKSLDGLINRNQVQEAFLTALEKTMTAEEQEKLVEEFKQVDLNQDGVITFGEFKTNMEKKKLGEVAERAFKGSDTNKDGVIDAHEFFRANLYLTEVKDRTKLDRIFQFFDADGSGLISEEEFVVGLGDTPESKDAFRAIFKEMDSNLDGKLSYDEFSKCYDTLFPVLSKPAVEVQRESVQAV